MGASFLVLEPQDGGDAQAHASDFYLVEQYKTPGWEGMALVGRNGGLA